MKRVLCIILTSLVLLFPTNAAARVWRWPWVDSSGNGAEFRPMTNVEWEGACQEELPDTIGLPTPRPFIRYVSEIEASYNGLSGDVMWTREDSRLYDYNGRPMNWQPDYRSKYNVRQLISDERLNTDESIRDSYGFEYYPDGSLMSVIVADRSDGHRGLSITSHKYEQGSERGKLGRLRESAASSILGAGEWTYRYSYTGKALVGIEVLDQAGPPIARRTFKYGSGGRLIEVRYTDQDSTRVRRFSYDSRGRAIRMELYEGGTKWSTERYTYNEKNKMVRKAIHYGQPDNRVMWEVYDSRGNLKREIDWGRGWLGRTLASIPTGPFWANKTVYSYKFDKRGNWVNRIKRHVVFKGFRVRAEPIEEHRRRIGYADDMGDVSDWLW